MRTAQKRNKFVMRVSNTSVGLTNEEKVHLFRQSFFRGKEARRVNPSGMGVGLLVAKTIVEAHKGKVVLESSSEKGTIFMLVLPLSSE